MACAGLGVALDSAVGAAGAAGGSGFAPFLGGVLGIAGGTPCAASTVSS